MDDQTRVPDFVLQRLRKVERERQGKYVPEVEGIKPCSTSVVNLCELLR